MLERIVHMGWLGVNRTLCGLAKTPPKRWFNNGVYPKVTCKNCLRAQKGYTGVPPGKYTATVVSVRKVRNQDQAVITFQASRRSAYVY